MKRRTLDEEDPVDASPEDIAFTLSATDADVYELCKASHMYFTYTLQ